MSACAHRPLAPNAEPAPQAVPTEAKTQAQRPSHSRGEQKKIRGLASWYGRRFKGHRTASGERFDPQARTAAHRTLPFGTVVEIKNLATGRTTRVRINDRGPVRKERLIDLSWRAAKDIGLLQSGTARVELTFSSSPSQP